MAKFCTKCGKKLEEGEICTCSMENVNQDAGARAESVGEAQGQQEQYYQQEQQASYYQQGQEGQYYQQGDPNAQYYQQGQGGQYYQQGDPNAQYYQQGQGGQYYQQGDPNAQYYQQGQGGQYYQQGPNGYYQQGRTKEAEWFNEKKNAFVAGTKNMFSEILPILKAPVSRVREIALSNNMAVGMEFIVAKAVLFVLLAVIILLKIKDSMGMASDYVQIPYLKIILIIVALTAGLDFLEAFLLKVFTSLFNGITNFNAMVSVVGARAMYDSMIVVVVGILFILSPSIALYASVVLIMITPYIEYAGYQTAIQMDENKMPYAFFVVKVVLMIIVVIFAVMMVQDFATGLATSGVGGLLDLL